MDKPIFRRKNLLAIILMIGIVASVGASGGLAQASAPLAPGGAEEQTIPEGMADASTIQPELPYKLYLPFITRGCSPLFADDFSNPASGWPVGVDHPITWAYSGGEYLMQISDQDWWAGAYRVPPVAATDFRAAVSVRNATGDYDTYYGLVFGLTPDWTQFYVFEISPDGWYYIFKYDNNTWTPLDLGNSPYIYLGILTNRLVIERNGSTIKAYANNQLLTEIVDASFTGARYIGIIVENYGILTLSGYFDNFGIYPLTCSLADIGSASLAPAGEAQLLSLPELPRMGGRLDSGGRFAR